MEETISSQKQHKKQFQINYFFWKLLLHCTHAYMHQQVAQNATFGCVRGRKEGLRRRVAAPHIYALKRRRLAEQFLPERQYVVGLMGHLGSVDTRFLALQTALVLQLAHQAVGIADRAREPGIDQSELACNAQ